MDEGKIINVQYIQLKLHLHCHDSRLTVKNVMAIWENIFRPKNSQKSFNRVFEFFVSLLIIVYIDFIKNSDVL